MEFGDLDWSSNGDILFPTSPMSTRQNLNHDIFELDLYSDFGFNNVCDLGQYANSGHQLHVNSLMFFSLLTVFRRF
jgi:hypothetical protein